MRDMADTISRCHWWSWAKMASATANNSWCSISFLFLIFSNFFSPTFTQDTPPPGFSSCRKVAERTKFEDFHDEYCPIQGYYPLVCMVCEIQPLDCEVENCGFRWEIFYFVKHIEFKSFVRYAFLWNGTTYDFIVAYISGRKVAGLRCRTTAMRSIWMMW